MFLVGDCSVQARRLCSIGFEAMWLGIRQVAPGHRLGDLGHAIQQYVESQGYSVVREYCGHGIGRGLPRGPAGAALRRAGHRVSRSSPA